MKRAFRVALTTFLTPFILVVGGIVLTWAYMRSVDTDYARSFFRTPMVEIERVIGSKRWSNEIFDCTYAVVKISEKSSFEIAKLDPQGIEKIADLVQDNQSSWPKGWQSTPITDFGPLMCSEPTRLCCFDKFEKADSDTILKGLREPGGWASIENENFAFVLPIQRIVGAIRYGD